MFQQKIIQIFTLPLPFLQPFKQEIFNTQTHNFEHKALELFKYQALHNPTYHAYLSHLRVDTDQINEINKIPFLPIEFFKTQQIITAQQLPQVVFESSRTTGQVSSKHYVADTDLYKKVSSHIFESFYGPLADIQLFALLPSYLERTNSSLVYMIDYFLQKTNNKGGFYLYNQHQLIEHLLNLRHTASRVILIGVTYALLDLAEQFAHTDLSHVLIMETGGMKGKRQELLREELHVALQEAFNVSAIHAEYGMTELLSQAYSLGNGVFKTPPWMQVLIRDINDPFTIYAGTESRSGGINIIDLANTDSCAFIETKDMGLRLEGNHFRVLGRFDNSDIRGCNLMLS